MKKIYTDREDFKKTRGNQSILSFKGFEDRKDRSRGHYQRQISSQRWGGSLCWNRFDGCREKGISWCSVCYRGEQWRLLTVRLVAVRRTGVQNNRRVTGSTVCDPAAADKLFRCSHPENTSDMLKYFWIFRTFNVSHKENSHVSSSGRGDE